MVPPVKGDYTTIAQVMNAQARKVADAWEPSMDGRCEVRRGAMRIPGRLRISWQDDATLKIETDAGAQTRLLHFTTGAAPAGPRTLQGYSVAEWQRGGGQQDAFLGRGVGPAGGAQRWGGLKVTTRNMLAGWLRPNGVPRRERYCHRTLHPFFSSGCGGLVRRDDRRRGPASSLTQPFITSTNFKKESTDAKFKPVPCKT